MTIINQIISILKKEIKSEFRRRYSISAIILFILTTISMLFISLSDEDVNAEISSALLWIIIFFGAMTGLSKSFISEEERQTSLFLKLIASSSAIYFGKLIYNLLLIVSLNFFSTILFFLFINTPMIIKMDFFIANLLFGSIGIASASTIISAIISKANTKNTLFPVLSFPILIPLFFLVINNTVNSFYNNPIETFLINFTFIITYSVVLIAISTILFDIIWED